jgi:putative hemolysin
MEDPLPILIAVILLLFLSAFLALAEHALTSARKPRLQAKAEGGSRKYRRAQEAAENPEPYRRALEIGVLFLDILAGALAGLLAGRSAMPATASSGVLTTALSGLAAAVPITLAALFLGGFLAGWLARLGPESILACVFPFMNVLKGLGAPLRFIGRRINAPDFPGPRGAGKAGQGITEDELRIALQEGEKSGIVESQERSMVEGVFYLGDRPVGAFMTHRSEIEWLDVNAGREEVRKAAVEFRHQRCFPVAAGALDEIVGIVSVEDILLALLEQSWKGLKALMKPPRFVPETISALKAFDAFKQGEEDFLMVIDEYGGFAGVLSVSDLTEEIVGELSVSGEEEEKIRRLEDGSYLAGGSANIDDVIKILSIPGLNNERQEYHTLAGFILELAGEIPRTGTIFEWKGFRFKIADMDGNRIDQVLIYMPPLAGAPEEPFSEGGGSGMQT